MALVSLPLPRTSGPAQVHYLGSSSECGARAGLVLLFSVDSIGEGSGPRLPLVWVRTLLSLGLGLGFPDYVSIALAPSW
eukprot:scaffold12456_cov36-Tisochrysis_lutea.AAC.1